MRLRARIPETIVLDWVQLVDAGNSTGTRLASVSIRLTNAEIRFEDDACMLFGCDSRDIGVTDTWCGRLDGAKTQARRDFAIDESDWVEHDGS